jgi:hypothetical protein
MTPGRPLPIPLRPDPAAVRENAVRSLTRAVLALGLNANDRRIYPTEYAGRTWPHDRDVPSISATISGRPQPRQIRRTPKPRS